MENKDLDKEVKKLKEVIMSLPAQDIISQQEIKDFEEKLNIIVKKLKDENKT